MNWKMEVWENFISSLRCCRKQAIEREGEDKWQTDISGSGSSVDFDSKFVVPRGKLMGVGRDWDFPVLYVVVVSGVVLPSN